MFTLPFCCRSPACLCLAEPHLKFPCGVIANTAWCVWAQLAVCLCTAVCGAEPTGKQAGSAAGLGTEVAFSSAAAGQFALSSSALLRRRGEAPAHWRHPVEARHPAGCPWTPYCTRMIYLHTATWSSQSKSTSIVWISFWIYSMCFIFLRAFK